MSGEGMSDMKPSEVEPRFCRGCETFIEPDEWIPRKNLIEPTFHGVSAGDDQMRRCGPLVEAITSGSLVFSPTTGEVFAIRTPGEKFEITDRDSAEWAMERIFEAEADLEALIRREEILLENLRSMRHPIEKRVEWLRARFAGELEEWARAELEGSKTRTVKTPFGKISFRGHGARISIADHDRALEWAKAREDVPDEAIKITEKLLISKIPEPIMEAAIDANDPPPGFKLELAGETCSIDTGAKTKAIT